MDVSEGIETSTSICGDFRNGQCSRSSCSYLHNINVDAPKSKFICPKFAEFGQCPRPFGCKFIHNVNPRAALDMKGRAGRLEPPEPRRYSRPPGRAGRLEPPEPRRYSRPPGMPLEMPMYGQDRYSFDPYAEMYGPNAYGPLNSLRERRYRDEFRHGDYPANYPSPKRRKQSHQVFQYCGDFSRGKCERSTCSYVHNINSNADRSSPLCGDFSKGSCERSSCRYIHNDNKKARITREHLPIDTFPGRFGANPYMQPPPMMHQMSREMHHQYPPREYGRRGRVELAEPRRYSRPPDMDRRGDIMRPMASYRDNHMPPNRSRGIPVTVCMDFSANKCSRDVCRYVHNINAHANLGKDAVLCGDFKKGKCERAMCKYLHPLKLKSTSREQQEGSNQSDQQECLNQSDQQQSTETI